MRKFIAIFLSFFLGLILIVFFFSPIFLSTPQGKKFFIWILEQKTQSKVKVEKLSFTLFKSQRIEKFHILKEKAFDFGFEYLESKTFFWGLFFSNPTIQNIHIENPYLTLFSKKIFSLLPSKAKDTSTKPLKKKNRFYPSLKGTFSLNGGDIHFQKRGSETISIANFFLSMKHLQKDHSFLIKTKGKTKQGDLFGYFDSELQIYLKKRSSFPIDIDGMTLLHNIPTEAIDFFIALVYPQKKGLLPASLGDSLNLNLSLKHHSKTPNLSFQFRSPRLFISLLANEEKESLSLKEPMRLAWTIKPYVINSIFKIPFFKLKSDLQAELNLEKARLPIQKGLWDFSSLSATGKLDFKQGLVILPKSQNSILIDQIALAFRTSQLSSVLTLSFENKFRFDALPTTLIEGSSKWHHLFSDEISDFNFPSQLRMHANNFPTKLLDVTFFKIPYLQRFLGSNLDFQAKFEKSKTQKKDLFFSLSSPYLNLTTGEFSIDQAFSLNAPLTFTYLAMPKQTFLFPSPFKVEATVNAFHLPLEKRGIAWKKMQLKCDFQTSPIDLSTFFVGEKILSSSLQGALEGKSLDLFSLSISSQISFPKKHWLGLFNPLPLNLSAEGDIYLENTFQITPLLLTLQGEKWRLKMEGKVLDHILTLDKPLKIAFPIQPQALNPFLKKKNFFPLLKEKAQLQLQIKKAVLPLKKENLSQLELKAYGIIQEFQTIPSVKGSPPFSLENIDLELNLNGKKRKNSLQCDVDIKTHKNQTGHIEFLLKNEKSPTDLFESPSYLKIDLEHLSSQTLETFFQMKGILSSILGPEINAFYEITQNNENKEIKTHLSSSYLQIEGAFNLKKNFLKLKNKGSPFNINLQLSEKSLNAYKTWKGLKKTSFFPYEIKGHSKIHVSFDQLSLPLKEEDFFLFPKIHWNLYPSTFNTIIDIESIVFKENQKREKSELSNFDLKLKKQSIKEPLFFEMDGTVALYKKKKEEGKIEGKGHIQNFLTKEGAIDFKNITTSINFTFSHFPTLFLDAVYQFKTSSKIAPSAILGNFLNATCLIEENGKIFIDLNASACKTLLKGKVKKGIFSLDEPLNATIAITPQMNKQLDLNSGLKIAAMKHPISLKLSHKNFRVPIQNLHIKNTTLSHGEIDFGRLLCQNRGNALELGEIFKIEHNQNLIELWFAPLEFQINKGILWIDRTEILFNHAYQIALWGSLNFRHRFAQITLGLTAQSLEEALGIKNLHPNYVFQIPLEGPFGNIKIDKGAVTSKLALLFAQKALPPNKSIWGQVLGTIGSFVDDQSKVPPPKSPFPWEH